VTDGEFLKPGFFTYIQERLEGFEARPNQKLMLFQQEVAAFPEYYAQYFKEAMLGGTIVPVVPVICVGPVKYRGEQALQKDIDNPKAAATAAGVPHDHVFVSTKAHGTGLGLAICRMIVEGHGGRLTASSDGESGALFQFVLPIGSTDTLE
jgi:5-methyltetrahydropteroyltriglutamate--homocysteine methyltransferase